MKKVFIILLVTVIILMSVGSLISCGPGAPAKPVTLRLAGPWPPMDPVTEQLQAFADGFNARAPEGYKMEVHPGESLVKMMESLDAVRTGAVEMAGMPIAPFSANDPRFAAAEVPFLVNNAEADAAIQERTLPMYSKVLEEKFNQKAISSFTVLDLEPVSTRPVKTSADWKGLLVHAISPIAASTIERLGGAPVAMPFPEIYSGLDKGTVDASMFATTGMIAFKIQEVASHVTLAYIIPAAVVIDINLDVWNKLPNNVQDLLVEEGLKAQRETNARFVENGKKNPGILAGLGIDVYVLPQAEREKWREAVRPYSEKLIADMGDFGQELLKIAAEINAKYPY